MVPHGLSQNPTIDSILYHITENELEGEVQLHIIEARHR
jgi:hypothetical protein